MYIRIFHLVDLYDRSVEKSYMTQEELDADLEKYPEYRDFLKYGQDYSYIEIDVESFQQ